MLGVQIPPDPDYPTDPNRVNYAKYGKSWRYIYELHKEINERKTRQYVLRSSLILNAVLLLVILYMWWVK